MLRVRREAVTFGLAITPGGIEDPGRIGEYRRSRGEEHVCAVGQFEPCTLGDLVGEDAGLPLRFTERVLEVLAETAPPHRLGRRLAGELDETATVAAVPAEQATPALPDGDASGIRRRGVLDEVRGDRGEQFGRHVALVRCGELAAVGGGAG